MEKRIKKEIKKQLRAQKPSIKERDAAWERLIIGYLEEKEGTETAAILRGIYINGWGPYKMLRELNRLGFYMSHTVLYERLNEGLEALAIRAAYEHLINPYETEVEP